MFMEKKDTFRLNKHKTESLQLSAFFALCNNKQKEFEMTETCYP